LFQFALKMGLQKYKSLIELQINKNNYLNAKAHFLTAHPVTGHLPNHLIF